MKNDGFYPLILLSFGVLITFTLIAYLPTLGVQGPWADVNTVIVPLVFVICFIGMVVYMVTHR